MSEGPIRDFIGALDLKGVKKGVFLTTSHYTPAARVAVEGMRSDKKIVLIDGAHNPAGAAALTSYLHDTFGRPLPVVFGAMRDKDVTGLIQALAPATVAWLRGRGPRR
mgnify:CR=1 FL=1